MGCDPIDLIWDLIMKIDGMGEGQRPEVALILFGPPESGVDHNSVPCVYSVLDVIFRNTNVVVDTNSDVFDALALGGNLGHKFLGGVYIIFGLVPRLSRAVIWTVPAPVARGHHGPLNTATCPIRGLSDPSTMTME